MAWRNTAKTANDGVAMLFGTVTTSTDGTIDSSSAMGFSIAKTDDEVGRYTVTLDSAFRRLAGVKVTLQVADDAACTAAKGIVPVIRNDDVASDGTVEVQFVRPDTYADAEVQDGAIFKIEITVIESLLE